MREFVVSEAPLGRVATLARATIEEAGGVVAQHTETNTEFDHLQHDQDDWSRSGYIGTYKRYREDPVQLRIRVWASWPRRLFHGAVWLGLVEAVVFFAMSLAGVPPAPNVWILSAILTFAFLGLALLLYATSWADSADLEDKLARKLTARVRDDEQIEGDIYTVGEWEEHRQEVIEQAVAKAEREAPERPSRARKLASSVAQSSKGTAGQLLQRVRSDDEEEPEEDDASEEGEDEEPDGDPEVAAKKQRLEELKQQKREQEQEDDEGSSFLGKLPFLGSSEDDEDEPEEEPAQADASEGHDADEEGSSLLDKVPFLGTSEDDDGEALTEDGGTEDDEDERPDG